MPHHLSSATASIVLRILLPAQRNLTLLCRKPNKIQSIFYVDRSFHHSSAYVYLGPAPNCQRASLPPLYTSSERFPKPFPKRISISDLTLEIEMFATKRLGKELAKAKQKLPPGIDLVKADDFREWQMDIRVLDDNPIYRGQIYRLSFIFSTQYPIGKLSNVYN